MKKLQKTIPVYSAVSLLALLPLTQAWAGGWQCALQTVLDSNSVSLSANVDLFNHSFTVHPVKITDVDKRVHTLEGTIRRANETGKPDEIAYRITKERGAIKEIDLQINGAMWAPISAPMKSALGDYCTGKPMPEEKQQAVAVALEKAVNTTWVSAAEFLVAQIAIRGDNC